MYQDDREVQPCKKAHQLRCSNLEETRAVNLRFGNASTSYGKKASHMC